MSNGMGEVIPRKECKEEEKKVYIFFFLFSFSYFCSFFSVFAIKMEKRKMKKRFSNIIFVSLGICCCVLVFLMDENGRGHFFF